MTDPTEECYNHRVIAPGRIALCWFLILFPAVPARAQIENLVLPGGEAVTFRADRLEYLREQDRFIAEGSVEMIRGAFRLSADRAVFDNATRELTAEGGVKLEDGKGSLTADRVRYNLDTETGTLTNGTLFVEQGRVRVEADRIEKGPNDRYRVENATLTTCDFDEGESPLWRFRLSRAELAIDGYMSASNVRFEIRGIPAAYVPYLLMPVKTTRQTGLLFPRAGYSDREGIKYDQSLFWAIAGNQDATLSLDYRSARGIGGELEYRYRFSRDTGGEARVRVFDDRVVDRRRVDGRWRHKQVLFGRLHAKADLNLVNDIDQFRDLSEVIDERVRNTLESTFIVFQPMENQYVYLSGRYTKDLVEAPAAVPERDPVQRLPEAGYRLYPTSVLGSPLFAGLEATGTNFWVETEDPASGLVRARRMDVFPYLTARLNVFGLVVSPRAGWRGTWYSDGLNGDGPVHRSVGIYDVNGRIRFSGEWMDGADGRLRRLTHHVEPAVVYEYVPEVEQSDLPKFDDVDQLPAKNMVTYSLTNAVVGLFRPGSEETPARREILRAKITQSYDIRERREADSGGITARPFSNLRGELTVRPMEKTWVDVDGYYNLYDDRTVLIDTDLKTRPASFLFLSVGQRLTREGTVLPFGDGVNALSQSDEIFWYSGAAPMIRFLSGMARLDFPFGLSLAGRAYYDAEAEKFAEIDYGLQYDGDCWAMAVSYIDLPDENQVSFLITIKTAGSTESRAFLDLFREP